VYKANNVDARRTVQPITPEKFLKYLRPNKPSITKEASGNKGIKAM
jgi:hypothetical protein